MPKIERIFCNKCGTVTAHSMTTAENIEEGNRDWSAATMHQILLCSTCSTGTYRKRVWFSEWQDPDPDADPSPVYDDTYYPPRLKKALPIWHNQLPDKLQEVLQEAYTALQHDLRYVSAVGCRTALDMAIVEKIGDVGRFEDKVRKLAELKHISGDEKDLILAVSVSGDAAAHRGFKPGLEHLHTLFDIVEKLLHKFYIKPGEEKTLLEAARKFRAKVPPRPGKQI